MEDLSLPSVETVLDKVKSDGTFDQFRKTCLAAVEAEPSMRAYGEQIEVLSRHYLQDHHHKWSDNITKNEVRAKLKDYIIKMIANPDVGISIPVQNMVENSLEKNGPKVLLPQVIEAVTSLQKAASEASIADALPSGPIAYSGNDTTVPVDTAPTSKAELGSLDLPISIPGLNSNRKESGESIGIKGGIKKDGTGNTVEQVAAKVKLKSKTINESTVTTAAGAKEEKSAAVKVVGQKGSKPKLKEKDDKSLSETERSDATKKALSELSEENLAKSKGNVKANMSSKEDRSNQKDKDSDKQSDRNVSTIDKEGEKMDTKEEPKKEANDKDKPELDLEAPAVPEQTIETSKESKREESDTVVSGGSTRRRKQSVPKRRSARLASLNDESGDEHDSNTSEKTTNNLTENKEIDSGIKPVIAESGKKKVAATEKPSSSSSSRMSGGTSRKRLHVFESSSDDEEQREMTHQNISSDEMGYESETEQQQQKQETENSGEGKNNRWKRKRARKGIDVTDATPQLSESHTLSSKILTGQKRSLSVGKDDGREERRSNSPVTKKLKTKPSGRQEKKQSPNMQKSPSPVVVTRYNRRVKPNRRYTSPTEDSSSNNDNDGVENS